jgi:predicted lipid-binding transport protein (Tim44 family)
MKAEVTMRPRASWLILGSLLIGLLLLDTAAVWARAGSGGSRGSRSYSTPASPSSPSRVTTPPAYSPSPMAQQRPSMFGGLMGGLAGFALGGLLGSMLFGGMGAGFGGGLGLLEILLIGGAAYFLFRTFRARQQQPAAAYAGAGSAYSAGQWSGGGGTTVEAPPSVSDLDRGLGHIRGMDAGFDPDAFAGFAKSVFTDVQAGIVKRDLGGVQSRLTPQQYARLQAQCDQLRGARRTNRIEQLRIKQAQVSEAWQESGEDWVTVYFAVSMIDYTVDDGTGAVVEGATSPIDIEEYWTFTRPVGPKPWRLSAIQTA